MDTIYLVAPGPYLDDVLEGFATDEDDIRQIIVNHCRQYCFREPIGLDVDLETKRIIAHEEDDWTNTYVIHEIKRAKPRRR